MMFAVIEDCRRSATDLSGKVVLVAGSDENHCLVKDLLNAGAAVVYPSGNGVSALQGCDEFAGHELLHRPVCNPSQAEEVYRLARYCDETLGGLDAVVVNFGEHGAGPKLTETTDQDLTATGSERFVGSMLLARALSPILAKRPAAAYIFINDSNSIAPARGGCMRSAMAAAELSMAQSLAFEAAGKPFVYSLLVTASGNPYADVLDQDSVSEAVALIVKHPGHAKGDVVIRCGWRAKLDPLVQAVAYSSCL